MRCKFCGSTSLHPDTQHKTFSTGKAVAGAVVFGVVGAAAGLIGKDLNGYRCGACGSFMDSPMDSFTEIQVNGAIRDAEAGRSRALFDYYKGQYPNIQANIPAQVTAGTPVVPPALPSAPVPLPAAAEGDTIKRSYRYGLWQPDCPIYVESVILHAGEREDRLSLIAWNQSDKTVRSAYFRVRVLDDTGDEVSTTRCVYQNLSVPGADSRDDAMLPADKLFPLGTDLAYRVELTCEKVAFEGDEIWRQTEDAGEIALPVQPLLTAENFPRIRYIKTQYADMQKFQALRENIPYAPRFAMPVEQDAFWLCCCGHPAKKGEICPYCRDTWPNVEKAFSQKELREIQQKEVKERAAQRAAKTWPLYEAAAAEKARKEEAQKNSVYTKALGKQKEDTISSVQEAWDLFHSLKNYRDSAEKAAECEKRLPELEEAERKRIEEERLAAEKKAEEERIAAENAAKKRKKTLSIAIPAAAVCIAAILLVTQVIIPNSNYNKAKALLDAGQYDEAITAFTALGDYKDSVEQSVAAQDAKAEAERLAEAARIEAENAAAYEEAEALFSAGDYDGAITAFKKLGDYRDSKNREEEVQEVKLSSLYEQADKLAREGKTYESALAFYQIKNYRDSWQRCFDLWGIITQRESLSTGIRHTVGLHTDGTVVAAGSNYYGQCNVSTWRDIVAISANSVNTVGLRADGTVAAVGSTDYNQCAVSAWRDIVAVAVGDVHTVGLRADGTVVAVGYNKYGQCDVSAWRDIVAVSAGSYHTVGLCADGTVVAVGANNFGQRNVEEWTEVMKISAGGNQTAGLRSDGSVVAVGINGNGQCDTSSWTRMVGVSVGGIHTIGLRDNGTVIAVGSNQNGQCNVSGWRNIEAISANFHTVGLRSDGTVVAVGPNYQGQCDVSDWTDIKLPNT